MDELDGIVDRHDILSEFLHGWCHVMAIALHEATGLPIGVITGGAGNQEFIVHAFVIDDDHVQNT